MASRASRDKRIAAADKKIAAAAVRRTKGQELIAEADAVTRKAEADKEWLASMPVDDEPEPEPTESGDVVGEGWTEPVNEVAPEAPTVVPDNA